MIILRDIESNDKDMIREWRNKSEISEYMYTDHIISPEEHERWFTSVLNDPTSRYWIIVCDNKDVGLVNIYDLDTKNQRCFWAFYVAEKSARGKGVGSFVEYSILEYTFGDLELNKLCCEVLGFNKPVVNMHNSFGFQKEGLFRKHIYKKGKYYDVVRLAILREEWMKTRTNISNRLQEKGII
jgi:UDP-4-amino-4,6-dideoxy-N-acetyl-beta-L-altrosamine N-acetyltransferase